MGFSDAFRMSLLHSCNAIYPKVFYDKTLFENNAYTILQDVDLTSGFGGVAYNLIKKSPGHKITLAGNVFGVSDGTIIAAKNREIQQQSGAVWHQQPKERWTKTPFERNIAIVPFETTRAPASWKFYINGFDALFVPCEQNVQLFRDSGVTIPIEVIHWGIDPALFAPITRPKRSIFTIGTMGSLSVRKGTDILIEAFLEAFPKERDVRLLCKTSNNYWQFGMRDKRIKVITLPVSHEELLKEFFYETDLFVFPTRGEGFGIPPLEVAATGIPSIVTNWSGPKDYLTDEMGWKLEYTMEPAKDFTEHIYKEDCGDWAKPSKEHLVHLLRYAYEHQDEVREKGKTAAEYIQREWLWEKRIKEYHTALSKYL